MRCDASHINLRVRRGKCSPVTQTVLVPGVRGPGGVCFPSVGRRDGQRTGEQMERHLQVRYFPLKEEEKR